MSECVMLLAEDSPSDVFFFREALEASQVRAAVHVVTNGRDALKFLGRRSPYADAPRPDVMVLDLNLPVKNGREVIQEMAADPTLRSIPVAILTTSASEAHVSREYPGRCLYLVKTDDFSLLQNFIRQIVAHAGGVDELNDE